MTSASPAIPWCCTKLQSFGNLVIRKSLAILPFGNICTRSWANKLKLKTFPPWEPLEVVKKICATISAKRKILFIPWPYPHPISICPSLAMSSKFYLLSLVVLGLVYPSSVGLSKFGYINLTTRNTSFVMQYRMGLWSLWAISTFKRLSDSKS